MKFFLYSSLHSISFHLCHLSLFLVSVRVFERLKKVGMYNKTHLVYIYIFMKTWSHLPLITFFELSKFGVEQGWRI